MNRSISFRPFDFAGISFHLEILVALGATEAEQLRVVSDKTNAVTRVNRGATEPTLLKTHIITSTRMRTCVAGPWVTVETCTPTRSRRLPLSHCPSEHKK